MSDWLHVAAVIRVDDLRLGSIINFDEIFGKECLWDAPSEVWDDAAKNPDKYLPMGSEGSLHKSVWVNPNESELAAYTITIWGDMRDAINAQKVVDWFKEKCDLIDPLRIRNAVIVVEGASKPITWALTY